MKSDVLLLLLLTALLWGVTPVLEKIGLGKTDPLTGVTIRSLAVTIGLLLYLISTGRISKVFQVDIKTASIFITTGLIAGLFAMLTYFTALKKGATSQVVPIAATYPLIAAALSVLILGEKVNPARIIGTLFIVIGVWFVQN